jgi:diacylglycerol kinase (ATP)
MLVHGRPGMDRESEADGAITVQDGPAGRVVVVLNPASGRGTGRRSRPLLEAALTRAFGVDGNLRRWEIRETTAPGSGTEIARRAAKEGAGIVAAAGGDGTYGEVVNGLVGTDACLGVLPLGTGNDFARALGLAGNLDLAARALAEGCPKPIDLGRIGERYFINIAGCGFDAAVAKRVNRANRGFRWLHGTAAYVAAVLQTLATWRAAEMCVTIDGDPMNLRAMLCCVANTPSYGGGMRIAPAARIDDGLLDVCILREAGRLEFLRAFPRVFKGTHLNHPKFFTRTARRITIQSDIPLQVLVDGDVTHATPVTFEVAPSAIRVMMPPTGDRQAGQWNTQ